MPIQTSPFIEAKYGWAFGESGWNSGMDENLLKFSFMFDGNIDGVVSSLPTAVNGAAYFLTTDNRLYFAANSTWYSTVTPKWFQMKIRSSGNVYQFNGTTAVQIDSPAGVEARLDAVELTVSALGTAAFEDVEFFATQAELDVAEAEAADYTDILRSDLSATVGLGGGDNIGFDGALLSALLVNAKILSDYTALRAYTGQATGVRLTATGIAGQFYLDAADTTSADNGGTIIIDGSGRRWKRLFVGAVNIRWFGAVGDGSTDDTAAFVAAIALGVPLKIPACPVAYLINASSTGINLFSGSDIEGEGFPEIRAMPGSNGRIFRAVNLSNIRISKVKLNGNKSAVTGNSAQIYIQDVINLTIEDCDLINACGNLAVVATSPSTQSCRDITFKDNRILDSAGTAVDFVGVYNARALDNTSQGHVGFAWRLSSGANHCLIRGTTTVGNGIECVGVTYDCFENRIESNHAEQCGDNGISITGYNNTAKGNICLRNKYSGLELYGKLNTASANVCMSNGQVHNPSSPYYDALNVETYAGVAVVSGWGGVAQYNSVTGNVCDDDQASPTQNYGVKLGGASYSAWVASTVTAAGTYIRNGNNVYYTTAGGTTGSTAPTHTSGTVSDGGVSWTWVTYCFSGTSEALGNTVGPNTIGRFVTGDIGDFTINNSNLVIAPSFFKLYGSGSINRVTAGFSRRAAAWTSSQAVTYGTIRYNSSTSQTYICVNAGGTCANVPTHLSGTVTGADGIAWRYYIAGQFPYQLPINTSDVSMNTVMQVLNLEDGVSYAKIIYGTSNPEGVVAAEDGSIYLRKGGGAGLTFYVKESGSGNTGWVAK